MQDTGNKKKRIYKSTTNARFDNQFEKSNKWYKEISEDPEIHSKVSEEKLIALKDEAKKCNDAEVATYNIKNAKMNSEYQWMKTVMSKGTLADKIAAYTLLIQDDPVCNLSTLHNLINMVKVGKKKECTLVIDNLSDLFLSDLLRPNTKLKPFHQRPLSALDELSGGNVTTKRKYLSFWYFEDQLKENYTSFVQALNHAAQDSVDANKEKAISAMHKLLVGNPEQEKNLLGNIVNKLGDPSQKIASKVIYCLGQVLYEHPVMKQVILNEIERLLFRSNISTKAQYYGICFLGQFCLNHEDFEVAKNLIAVYFAFFKACIKKEEVDSRMMSALLVGVNRAYPYAQTELNKISEHIDTVYKVVHIANLNVSLHALNLLSQISDHNEAAKDRFYSALYRKLLDLQISVTKHQALLLNLIFRALKKDTNAGRIRAFIKRLLQLSLYMQPALTCGILFLIQQVIKGNKGLLALSFESAEVFAKDEDDVEKYEDVPLDETNNINDISQTSVDIEIKEEDLNVDADKPDISKINPKGSWNHSAMTIKSEYNHPDIVNFNALARNPLYAGGQFCVYIELINLQKHYHPTVSLFASKLLNAENIMYSGDPLKDFTLTRFLERFSFKNPKTVGETKKKGVNPVFGKRKMLAPTGLKSHAVNSGSYLSADQSKIPVEELFMYNYLHKKHVEKKNNQDEDDSDADSVASDEFEEMLNKMNGKKRNVEDQDELDFMNEIGESLKNQSKDKKKNKDGSDDDFEDDDDDEMPDDDEDNESDYGVEFSDNDELQDDDIDNDNQFEAGDDSDLDGESDLDSSLSDDDSKTNKKPKNMPLSKKKKKEKTSVFASADDFAELLDEEPDFMAGSSQAVSNKDNAHIKQLSWEQNRHKWIKGFNKSTGGKGKKNFNNKKFNHAAGNKRQKPQQGGNKKKKNKY